MECTSPDLIFNFLLSVWHTIFYCHVSTLKKSWLLCQSVIKVKVKLSRYRPGVVKRVGSGIALLFHDHGTRRGWVVSSMPQPYFTPGKDPVPILQEAGWVPGPVWTGRKSCPHQDSISDRPARSQSLYWITYLPHVRVSYQIMNNQKVKV
jgi:hypothetical protein